MERRVQVEGRELRVRDAGSGRPLLFVHGFPLDHTMWRRQYAELTDACRVLAIDLPGFGGSAGSGAAVTSMAEFADACAATLDALEIREPVVFCGLSMGGYVAWQFWARHAARLAALVVCDTRAAADSPDAANNRLVMADRVLREGPAFLVDAMADRLFARSTRERHPELIDEVRHSMNGAAPMAIAGALRGMAERPDMSASLADMRLPALVVCGESDVISPAPEMRSLAANLPDATFVEVPDAGHMSPLEQPIVVNAALRQFLLSL